MQRPLEGIKILDFTHGVAGPYCSMLLGDLGADVIKIEKPGRGDASRWMNVSKDLGNDIPRTGGDYYLAINRNKRSVAVDLKTEEGRNICRELAKWADVVLQSFRPGVVKRLGLDYESLRKVNPKLIYGNLSAYGEKGPMAGKAGMDVAVQARAGVMSITGERGRDVPTRSGISLADFGGGVFLMNGITTALFHRERTGEGQEVFISLLDVTMSMLSNYSVACVDGGAKIDPMGSGHPQITPYEAYPTKDGHIVISAGTNNLYRDTCKILGVPELSDDPRLQTNPDRIKHRDILEPLMNAATKTKTTEEWLSIMEANDVPCAPVNRLHDAYTDPQVLANDMLVEIKHPTAGNIHVTGVPFKFSATKGDIRLHPPLLGEHTEDVLKNIVGLDDDALMKLRDAKAI